MNWEPSGDSAFVAKAGTGFYRISKNWMGTWNIYHRRKGEGWVYMGQKDTSKQAAQWCVKDASDHD